MASKSKYAIINAYLKLIETEEYEKITVTSLVEECNISRQTFYYHFDGIDEMIAFAFKTETEKICGTQDGANWIDSAKHYIDFLNTYDTFLRKAILSKDFINIYHLLYNSFYQYITSYIEKKSKKEFQINEETRFLLSCTAYAFCGLVIAELQKENTDYQEVLNKIAVGFNITPKQ